MKKGEEERGAEKIKKRYEDVGVKEVVIDYEEIKKLGIELLKHRVIEINSQQEVRHHSIRLASIIYSMLLDWDLID